MIIEYIPSQVQLNNKEVRKLDLPEKNNLKSDTSIINSSEIKVIQLEDSNMVVLRGPITEDSMSQFMFEIAVKSKKLKDSDDLYIVIDSPGGSVFAGLDMIDLVEALPQKVHTITLFSASMAFQTVQALGTRYILRNGTLMSHRARGGVQGQFDGELESRYNMVKRKIDYMEKVSADRMEISIEEYKKLIKDEYWVHGFDAVNENSADQTVLARCGKSLNGTIDVTYRTLFGSVDVTLSKCPLIRGAIKMDYSNLNVNSVNFVKHAMNLLFSNKPEYVKQYIITNKFQQVFGE